MVYVPLYCCFSFSPSPLTKQIITNGVIMNLLLDYGCYLMQCFWLEAMGAYKAIAKSLQFCFCQRAHNEQVCTYAKFYDLYLYTPAKTNRHSPFSTFPNNRLQKHKKSFCIISQKQLKTHAEKFTCFTNDFHTLQCSQ